MLYANRLTINIVDNEFNISPIAVNIKLLSVIDFEITHTRMKRVETKFKFTLSKINIEINFAKLTN